MLKNVDRAFGWLLSLGAALHAVGSFTAYDWLTPNLVWALSGSLAAALVAAVNLLRVNRLGDRALAWVSFAGSFCWLLIAIAFGASIHAIFDPRVLYHVVAAIVLVGFSLRAARV